MVAFGVIGILVILLIFFVFKIQTLHNQINQNKLLARQNANKANSAYVNLSTTAKALQTIFVQRLESASSKGLISGNDEEVLAFILRTSSKIIFESSEKKRTIEEGLTSALRDNQDMSIEKIQTFIQGQPDDIRMCWIKNTPEGFISAIDHITTGLLLPKKS
ncbi:hypothetical protein [Aestuariibacter sp. A3R04]|uniref:hypothetical protein n=1 Tax=Aestuariibacter sp. A3R04 TaxID=2841571 RepID=UPI001C087B59|nr:hypothetical protein [Aestuariibacter sp. A3R04]MBU3023869.1 hypothetical protein [Aestuariibacter sp. A3R04]